MNYVCELVMDGEVDDECVVLDRATTAQLLLASIGMAVSAEEIERTVLRQYGRRSHQANPHLSAEHRAKRAQRMPAWLTKEQRNQMRHTYLSRPDGWHVDHIVPLCGKAVSGLHVPWNLQLLPAGQNHEKSNSYEV